MTRERIDKLLVDRGLANSRAQAQALVMAGQVMVADQRVEKASALFEPEAPIRIKDQDNPATRFVGRGGLKLETALHSFNLNVRGFVCLDIGASTGGFTDCLLQNGARRVVALDVGHNQLDWRLRTDDRVEVRERVNARYLKPEDFDELFDLAVMDVSFISAAKILPAVAPLLTEKGQLVTLIKPQFEVGKGEVGKGGIVTDPEQHRRVIDEVNQAAAQSGLAVDGVIESPVLGQAGNREFLALYHRMSGVE